MSGTNTPSLKDSLARAREPDSTARSWTPSAASPSDRPSGSAPGSAKSTSPRSPQEPASNGVTSGSGFVEEVIALLDTFFDYLAAKFRLERYRIETQTRRLILKSAIILGSAVVLLIGLIFLSVGVADLIGQALESPAAGRLIVGGFYLLAGVIALLVTGRRGSRSQLGEETTKREGRR